MPGIVSSRTRRLYQRPPVAPFVLNKDCRQAQGLVGFWPIYECNQASPDLSPAQQYPMSPGAGPVVDSASVDGGHSVLFNRGSSQYLENLTAIVSAAPFTMLVWYNVSPTNLQMTGMCVADATVANHWTLGINYPTSARVGVICAAGGAASQVNTTVNHGAGEWHQAAAVIASTTSRTVYRDANPATAATATASRVPSGISHVNIGAQHNTSGGTTSNATGGWLMHGCLWNRVLTEDELWQTYDPRTRWELYYPVGRKTFGFSPPGGGSQTATPDVATITVAGVAPTASGSGIATATPGVATVTISGVAPAASGTGTVTATPGIATVTVSGIAPAGTPTGHATAMPGVATVTVSGVAPAAAGTGTGTATPVVATVTVSGVAPAAAGAGTAPATPGVGIVTISGISPAASGTGTATTTPGVGIVTVSGVQVAAGGTQIGTPGAAAVTVTGVAAAAAGSGQATATPGTATVTVGGFSVAATPAGAVTAAPGVAVINVLGIGPATVGGETNVFIPGDWPRFDSPARVLNAMPTARVLYSDGPRRVTRVTPQPDGVRVP